MPSRLCDLGPAGLHRLQKYDDMQAAERARYLEEYKTVYGVESPSVSKPKP